MIAVSITSRTCAEALEAISRVQGADLIELRLDKLVDFKLLRDAEQILQAALSVSAVPLIFTLRSYRPEAVAGETERQVSGLLATRQVDVGRDYFDFDHQSDCKDSLYLYHLYERIQGVPARVILSHHDFVGVGELEQIYRHLSRLAPDVVKIAVTASLLEETLQVMELLKEAQRPTIALAMGEAGRLSRLLAPSRGGMTFASLSRGSESAPGQFTLEEMLSLYRVPSIDMETSFYAVLGYPVSHSASPYIHNRAFVAAGLNSVYVPIAVPASELESFLRLYVRENRLGWRFCGASVTVPHKVSILKLLDWIDPVAARVGAVNTLVVADSKLKGYNTDVAGAILPLKQRRSPSGLRVSVLGAGGAARAVVAGLVDEGARVRIYARNPAQSRLLAEEFKAECGDFAEAGRVGGDVLINTTPVGMSGWTSDSPLPVSAEYLKNFGLVYDLVYNPERTPLLEAAEAVGVETLGGIEMLVAQAGEQYRLWTGLEPPLGLMEAAVRECLMRGK